MIKRVKKIFPRYQGQEWVKARLPERTQPWIDGKGKSLRRRSTKHHTVTEQLSTLLAQQEWRWPKRPVYFITDTHADADALLASLVASGSVHKTGPDDKDFHLTKAGRKGRFVIGGDCFDKGPSNLRLLRTLGHFRKCGADLRLLAGNHDIRVMLGMRSVGKLRNHGNEHFFVRMGPKAIPLLKEITEQYIDKRTLGKMPSNRECRRLLYPSEQWLDHFPSRAEGLLDRCALEREMDRFIKKQEHFEHLCEVSALSFRQVLAATLQWQKMFLKSGGEFHWFYKRMRLCYRQGSFLFIHAGLDDEVAAMIRRKGVKHVNKRFRKQFSERELSFYFGHIVNSIRTKYRAADHPLTKKGVRLVHESGIHAIIHGHKNVYNGQRISLRKNMINFECDTTMDSGSRSREGMRGAGAGVTIIHPDKFVLGISSDHEYVKVFDPLDLRASGE